MPAELALILAFGSNVNNFVMKSRKTSNDGSANNIS